LKVFEKFTGKLILPVFKIETTSFTLTSSVKLVLPVFVLETFSFTFPSPVSAVRPWDRGWTFTANVNLVPRTCDPQEGTRGSGIIRFREESDWPLKWNA
jgi:hypothetical protein